MPRRTWKERSSPEQLENIFRDAGYRLLLLDDQGQPIAFEWRLVRKKRDVIAVSPSARDIL